MMVGASVPVHRKSILIDAGNGNGCHGQTPRWEVPDAGKESDEDSQTKDKVKTAIKRVRHPYQDFL